MRAMVLEAAGQSLQVRSLPDPRPGPGEVLLRVRACGVCRTDLHILDGELDRPKLPLVPGHQIVGVVEEAGPGATLDVGTRVGVPWLAWTCGACRYCRSGRENLCERARFTGYDVDGGFAQSTVADARFCLPLPDGYSDESVAPLLCAGLIGYRSLRMAGEAERLGIYGFGAAGHLVAQVALHEGRRVFALTSPGDAKTQEFALRLGATWAGGSDETPPETLDAALVFAPVGGLVTAALRAIAPGGTVVCGGIHMSDIPSFPYSILWGERAIRSVANLTREDGKGFMDMAARTRLRTQVTGFRLEEANEALRALRQGEFRGAAVLSTG